MCRRYAHCHQDSELLRRRKSVCIHHQFMVTRVRVYPRPGSASALNSHAPRKGIPYSRTVRMARQSAVYVGIHPPAFRCRTLFLIRHTIRVKKCFPTALTVRRSVAHRIQSQFRCVIPYHGRNNIRTMCGVMALMDRRVDDRKLAREPCKFSLKVKLFTLTKTKM